MSYAGRVYYKSLNKILACESPYEAINDTIDKNLIVSVAELFDKYLEWAVKYLLPGQGRLTHRPGMGDTVPISHSDLTERSRDFPCSEKTSEM